MQYANALRPLLPELASGKVPSLNQPELREAIKAALEAAHADGRVSFPKAASDHAMRVATGLKELGRPGSKPRYHLDMVVEWLLSAHLRDLYMHASRILNHKPKTTLADIQDSVLNFGEDLIANGTFSEMLSSPTEIARSNWTENDHHLMVKYWEFHIWQEIHGKMIGLSVQRPIEPVQAPAFTTFTLRFPSGRLLIGSGVADPTLDEALTQTRRDAKGLQGQIAATNAAANEYCILQFPVHQRSLRVLAHDDEVAVVSSKLDMDRVIPHTAAETLLDYRLLTIMDETVLDRLMRETWDEDKAVSKARLDARLKAAAHTHERCAVQPGTYTITLPTNYQHELIGRAKIGKLGAKHHLLFHMRRVGD